MSSSISVDVISDVVCPWCFIGKRRLETALSVVPDIQVEVSWRPFQLDPTIPPGGNDRRDYMLGKFGSEERIEKIHADITPLGEAEGIRFAFDAIKISPNTLDAHRLIRWAATNSRETQSKLVSTLFSYYFEQGKDIGSHPVLLEAARESGMDVALAEALLPTDADREAVHAEIATASRMGVSGVPCFLLERKYAVMGAQAAETLADAIRQVAAEKAGASRNIDLH